MIRDVLDKLKVEDRRLLSYALDHDLSQVVRLDDNRFVGINIRPGGNMVINEQVGNWCYGEYIQKR